MTCTRCENTGFLNLHQVDDETLRRFDETGDVQVIVDWIDSRERLGEPPSHDVSVCDCCGNGDVWYGQAGEHDPKDYGPTGPYAYNGGLPECT